MLSGKVSGIYRPAHGQKFAVASVAARREQRDFAAAAYRGVHDQIAKGAPLLELWAEYMGKVIGSDMLGPRLVHDAHGLKVVVPSADADAKGALLSRKLSSRLKSDLVSTSVCERSS